MTESDIIPIYFTVSMFLNVLTENKLYAKTDLFTTQEILRRSNMRPCIVCINRLWDWSFVRCYSRENYDRKTRWYRLELTLPLGRCYPNDKQCLNHLLPFNMRLLGIVRARVLSKCTRNSFDFKTNITSLVYSKFLRFSPQGVFCVGLWSIFQLLWLC